MPGLRTGRSTFAYFEAMREYLGRHGKPLALYSDKASIFRVNRPEAAQGPGFTQFARTLYELNIDGICANTPAAKGRVERAHLTLQDRLVKELRLAVISSIAAAEVLDLIFAWCELRKVTQNLTLHYGGTQKADISRRTRRF